MMYVQYKASTVITEYGVPKEHPSEARRGIRRPFLISFIEMDFYRDADESFDGTDKIPH